VPERGNRDTAKTVIKTESGEELTVIGAADRDRQPMVLIGTAGATSEGRELTRNYTRKRAYGTFTTITVTH